MTMRCPCIFMILYFVLDIQMQESSDIPCHVREVNLLSESLLQLGSVFKKEVNNTHQSIKSVLGQLELFNVSLAKMSWQVMQIAKLGEDLSTKAKKQHMKDEYMNLFIAELCEELAKVQQHGASLENKIKPLESKLQKAVRDERHSLLSTTNILSTLKRQNIQIETIMATIDVHQDRINYQECKIQRLLKKIGSRNLKDIERKKKGLQRKFKEYSQP